MLLRELSTSPNGELDKQEKAFFGGEYGFWAKLRQGGTGSAKLIYESGIAAFDATDRGVENEVSFVTFELLRNGLVLRLNRNQRLRCVGIRLTELKYIDLVGYPIKIQHQGLSRRETKVVHHGELELTGRNGQRSRFSVITQNFAEVLAYFGRKELAAKFRYRISSESPGQDYGHLVDTLDGFL